MSLFDQCMAEIKNDLRENRLKRQRHEEARSLFHATTWAQEASTIYYPIEIAALGLPSLPGLLLGLIEFPTTLLVHPEALKGYADAIVEGSISIPAGNTIATYDDIFRHSAPTLSSLLIVENGKDLLEALRVRGKDVRHFFRWSVGDYPLPNLHTHLIFQPL